MKVYADIKNIPNERIVEIATISTDKRTLRNIAKAFRNDKEVAKAIIDNPNTSKHLLTYLSRASLLNVSRYARKKLFEKKSKR